MNNLNYDSYIKGFSSIVSSNYEMTNKAKKVAFSTLKLKVLKEYISFTFLDRTIQLISYLPVSEKRDIVDIAYQKATNESGFNPILFSVYFVLNIVYSYANLTFTDAQRENEMELFDLLITSGLFKEIAARIPASEWEFFNSHINNYVTTKLDADYSAMGIVNNGIRAVNTISSVISEKLSNVSDETLQSLIDNIDKVAPRAETV